MALIDISDFQGLINIGSKGSSSVQDKLQFAIELYENEYLTKALGENFFAMYNANFDEPVFEELTEILIKPYSPIACYIRYMYAYEGVTQAAGVGNIKADVENGFVATETFVMRQIWNKMVDRTREVHSFLQKNCNNYPDFVIYDTCKTLRHKINDFF